MKDSEALFQLIKSLSGPEKRYFKLLSSIYEGNKNYLEVFNILVKQKTYNEKSFRKKIKNKTILKQLPRIKNYLYELILKTLSSYHTDNSIRSRLNSYVEQITLLNSKSLFKHSRKLILKSKKLAYAIGNYPILIEIIKLEKRVSLTRWEFEKFKNIDLELEDIWNKMLLNRLYSKLNDDMFAIVSKEGKARTNEILKQAEKIIKDPLLREETKAIDYNSKYFYYQIHLFYSELQGDSLSSYKSGKAMLNLMENHPIRLIENQSDYIIVLNNLMNVMIDLKKYKELDVCLEKFKSIYPKNINIEILQFNFSCILEQDLFLKTGDFEKGILLQKKIKTGLELYDEKIHSTIQFFLLFNLSLLYFGSDNYSKSLQFLNSAMSIMGKSQRKDVQVLARIFNLIVHFELGNDDFLPYLLRSTYRYLLKQQKVYQYENFIIQFIRKLPKIPSPRKLKDGFIELRFNLKELEKDSFEKHAFGNFDIISWLDSKIEKRTFADIVREKANK